MTMRKILISLFYVICTSAEIYAAPNPLLHCLAKEEAQLFKQKNLGSLYRLNQEFINELASSSDITLKEHFINEICETKTTSPTIKLLRMLLLKESEIYEYSQIAETDQSAQIIQKSSINEFQKQVIRFFTHFLASIQSEMATPYCLEKAIPETKILFDRLKYLEEEISFHELLKDKNKIESIFKKLEFLPSIKRECVRNAESAEKKLVRKMKKKMGPNL